MHEMKLVKCRPIRSDYCPVVPWKTLGYLITLVSYFSNSWRIQRNFKREMVSSSAGPRTLLFIFDEPKVLARSKSSATKTLWTLQIRRVYPWVKYLSQISEQLTLYFKLNLAVTMMADESHLEFLFPFNHLDNSSFNLALYGLSHGLLNFNSNSLETLLFNPIEQAELSNSLSSQLNPDSNFIAGLSQVVTWPRMI